MKFTPFIAVAILAFTPVPALSIPLIPANLNQTDISGFRRVQPIPKVVPLSIAPNGIIAPGPADEPIGTTSTGWPFDGHRNIDGPSELEGQSGGDVASLTAHQHRNQLIKRPIIHETMAELLDNKLYKGKEAPNDIPRGFEGHPKYP